MKLYSYLVKVDSGLAPNPFWGYCTLAASTPNRMRICPEYGDWVAGASSAHRGHKLVYAMQVSEVIRFDLYYRDPRFEKKKPNVEGNWRECCGDNMYYLDKGEWKQHRTIHYRTSEAKNKALKYPFTYVAEHFYYFGDKAIEIPAEYQALIWRQVGCSGKHDPEIVETFLIWLQENFEPGILGNPMDNEEAKLEHIGRLVRTFCTENKLTDLCDLIGAFCPGPRQAAIATFLSLGCTNNESE